MTIRPSPLLVTFVAFCVIGFVPNELRADPDARVRARGEGPVVGATSPGKCGIPSEEESPGAELGDSAAEGAPVLDTLARCMLRGVVLANATRGSAAASDLRSPSPSGGAREARTAVPFTARAYPSTPESESFA